MVVPCRFRRERMICPACSKRTSRCGMAGTRLRMSSQSNTAEVGQRFGSRVMEPSISGLA